MSPGNLIVDDPTQAIGYVCVSVRPCVLACVTTCQCVSVSAYGCVTLSYGAELLIL